VPFTNLLTARKVTPLVEKVFIGLPTIPQCTCKIRSPQVQFVVIFQKYLGNREWDRGARCFPPPNPPFWYSVKIFLISVSPLLQKGKKVFRGIHFLQEVSSVPP